MLDGDVDHGDASSFALMDFERDEGKLLTCCAKPRSDVVIEADIDVDEDVEVHPVQDYVGTVVARGHRADTRRLVIELDRPMAFNAGQYLKFRAGEGRRPDVLDRELAHRAAAARVPHPAHARWARVRRVDLRGDVGRRRGLSPALRPLRPQGGRRPGRRPRGRGTGLAPIKSMIRHALENEAYEGHLTLYQGGRSREWLYDVDEFRRLEAEYPEQFTYRPCLSEETAEEVGADAAAAYGYGLVTDVIAADHASLSGGAGYLCGRPWSRRP